MSAHSGPETSLLARPRRSFHEYSFVILASVGLELRAAAPVDKAAIACLYASTREQELQQVPWNGEQKRAFTDWQSEQQERHYDEHYPGFERLLIHDRRQDREGDAQALPIGRLYINTTSEVRLMEITLLPPHRNQGIGSVIMDQILRYAESLALPISLHVEPFNPARRMYERLGFTTVETRGLYEFMIRQPSGTGARHQDTTE